MDRLIEIGLSNAAVATVLAVVAVLGGLVIRRPAVRHALWLLVLLKLLTPPLVSVRLLPVESPPPPPAPAAAADAPQPVVEPAPADEAPFAEAWPDEAEPDVGGVEVPKDVPVIEAVVVPEALGAEAGGPLWGRWIAGAWCIGSLAWFVLASWRVWRFSDALRHARPAPAELLASVARLAAELGLPRCPDVRVVVGRVAPMVWGLGRPVLLVPQGLVEQVGAAGLETLLLHELAHVRRGDHLVRWVEFLALGLYWWNPVVWYARRELREAEEQCCDAWVVNTLPGAGRAYATALVDVLDFLSGARAAPPLASGIGQVSDLKRRLKMILRGNTPPGLGRAAGLAVFALALFLLPMVPAWAQQGREERKDVIVRKADGRTDADLRRLEEELQKKMADIEVMRKRIVELRTAEARKTAEDVRKRAVVVKEQAREKSRTPVVSFAQSGTTIRIEISGLSGKAEDIEKLAKALEQALPGKDKKVIILRGGEGGLRFWTPTPKTPPTPAVRPAAPAPPAPPRPALGGTGLGGGFGGMMGGDRRIEGLEKKLDSIMKELEALRRELRRPGAGAPSRSGGGGRGSGPASADGIPARPAR